MYKAFKLFWKDLWVVCVKGPFGFVKKHFIGWVMFNAACIAAELAYFNKVFKMPLSKDNEK